MEYRNMQGIQIPPCMIGTWAWGEGLNGSRMVFGHSCDEQQLKETFQYAYDAGFTMWDTAEVYGMGNAEKLLGSLIRGKNALISTKHMPGKRFKEGAMEEALEGSCQRLEIKMPDLYWIHLPNHVEENVQAAIRLQKENRIRTIGVSNYSLEQIQQADAMMRKEGIRLAAVQNHFSLLSGGSEQRSIIDWCREHEVIYFSYMVLEQGALTGRYDEENHFKTFSLRGLQFSKRKFHKIRKLLEYEKELAGQYQVDSSQIPIAWAMARHTVPIVGLTKKKYAEQLNTAWKIRLTETELSRLETLAEESGVTVKGVWEPR